MHSDFNISSSSLFSASSSSQSGYVISSRMSSTSYQSVGIVSSRDIENANSYSVKGTTSFTAISSEVGGQVCTQDNLFDGPAQLRGRAYAGRPDKPPVGQEAPVGDMLLPLMLMAAGYLFVKLVRNRKKSQAL